jgi:hypothetical protein
MRRSAWSVRRSRLAQVTDGLDTAEGSRYGCTHDMHPSAPGSGGALARTWRSPTGLAREILGPHGLVGWAGRKPLGIAHDFCYWFPEGTRPRPWSGLLPSSTGTLWPPGFALAAHGEAPVTQLLDRSCDGAGSLGRAPRGVERGLVWIGFVLVHSI